MAKAAVDRIAAALGLLLLSPVLLVATLAVWLGDLHAPLYRAERAARGGRATFRIVKIRTMVVDADRIGGPSTPGDDPRVTPVGRFLRRFKIDELTQLWNVLAGDMSLVGPRPQVPSWLPRYTPEEMGVFAVKPGVTDFASIVFADEAEVLRGAADVDAAYDALIRPWKSRLGLFYVAHRSMAVDLALVATTFVAIVSRRRALAMVSALLRRLGAPDDLVAVARRDAPPPAAPPPGGGV
ncbi:MAG: sugar transferase [Rhodospirillales bacterium]|nr:MAG: sugar transferase [Rhodospirillales bacterium]